MPLELRPLTTTDTLSWTRIRALAYKGPTHNLIHSGPISESSIRGVAQDRKKEIGKPNNWQWKVVDTELSPSDDDPADNAGRTIAIAIWSTHNTPLQGGTNEPTVDSAEKGDGEKEDKPFLPPELKLDVLSALLTPLRDAQKDIMGIEKPYFMLNTLATHPEHRGRGAAKLLLDWGLKKADEEGLSTYLDTTQMARPIYEKEGFKLAEAVEFDRTKWGGEGIDWYGCMIRQPQETRQ